MRLLRRAAVLALVTTATIADAQEITPSVLNVFRYGDGRSGSGALKERFTYFEELMDLRLGLPRSFTVGVRFLYDAPPQIGPTFRGIKRRFAEFATSDVLIRAGNSSMLFGRGLALNLFEDRGLAYDTWLDGVKLGYAGSFFMVSAAGGRVEYWDSVVVARTETYDLIAANVEADPFPWITLGVSFVEADGDLPGLIAPVILTARIPEVYASLRFAGVEAVASWSEKRTVVQGDSIRADGWGAYGALSWAGKGIGIVADYKNYQYDIRDPFGRNDPARPTRMLPIQNPPTVQREHTWTFLTRALHQVDFNDEVGVQVEGFFKADDATTLTVSASLSSDHDYFEYQETTFSFQRRERDGSFLPSTDPSLSPYWEILLEGERYYGDQGIVRAAVATRRYTQAVPFPGSTDHIIRSLVVPGLVQAGLDELSSLTVQAEFESVSDNYNVSAEQYENYLLTLRFSRLPGLTLAVRSEFTSNPSDPSGRMNWFAGEVGYRLGGAHSIAITVGQERGGQVCTNGVCRYIQPFSGVRLAIQSNL
jgi:hypothetical protein